MNKFIGNCPYKRCYKHPRFMDVFIEVLKTYPTNTGIKIKVMWWNKNEYYGEKPYPMSRRPKTHKLTKSKWREFQPINWKKECGL